ncbi:MAG: hypothetical protein WBN40_04515 [Pseudomonadales bacterium]
MSFGLKQTSYEAVLYVSRKKVLKEMLYSEFEAVLDGVVCESDYRDQTCHAVYLKIDMRLNILSAVFFCIDFDRDGNADRRWNLPLAQISDSATVVTELNGQGVRISCRSRCRIAAQQERLWEPDLGPDSKMLSMLASCVKANRLGLIVEEGALDATSALPTTGASSASMRTGPGQNAGQYATGAAYEKAVASEQRHDNELRRLNENINKQRLYISSLKGRQEEALENSRTQHEREKESLLLQLEEACSTLKSLQVRNRELQQELQDSSKQSDRQRAAFEKQVSVGVNRQGLDFAEMQKQFRSELQQKLIEQTSELKARLDMRDVEAHYRDEQIKNLKAQLQEKASAAGALNAGSGVAVEKTALRDTVIELDSLGVNFVLTIPAIRPINIAAADVDAFCADPEGFVADRLGIEKPIYCAWIAHARNPVCAAAITDDCNCGARLEISHPREFVPDHSDRCKDHQNNDLQQQPSEVRH